MAWKTIIMNVSSCRDCPWESKVSEELGGHHECGQAYIAQQWIDEGEKIHREIEDVDSIPDWCPFDDLEVEE